MKEIIISIKHQVEFTLEQAMKAQIWSTLTLLFLELQGLMRWVVNAPPWPLYPRERDPVPNV